MPHGHPRRAAAEGALSHIAAWDRFAPIIGALQRAQVDWILVGIGAAVAHGLTTPVANSPLELDMVPAPVPANLRRMAEALSREKSVRLRADQPRGLAIELSPQLFAALPALPLACRFGDFNILTSRDAGSYARLNAHAVRGRLGSAQLLIASTAALLDGSAAGLHELEPRLLTRIAELHGGLAIPDFVPVDALAGRQRGGLEAAIMDALHAVGAPMTVRDLRAAVGAERAVTYQVVRRTVNGLATRGHLLRCRAGRANTYSLNPDFAAAAAARIAAALSEVDDIESTLARARTLLVARRAQTPE